VNAKITSCRSKYRSFCDFFDGYPGFDMLSILGIKDFLRLQCVEFKISVFCVATPRRDFHASKPEVRSHDCKHKYLDKKPLFKHDVGCKLKFIDVMFARGLPFSFINHYE